MEFQEHTSDRRRHPRRGASGTLQVGDYSGQLLDLSISGVAALLDGELVTGRAYQCFVAVGTTFPPLEIEAKAVVRNTQRQQASGRYRVGLEFLEISDAMHWRLMDFLAISSLS